MFETFYYKHYIQIGNDNVITEAWSDGPHPEKDTVNAICISEHGGYQLRLKIDGEETEENPNLFTLDGIPMFEYVNGEITMRAESKIIADREAIPPPPPSQMETMRADIDYLLVMGGLV